MKLDLQFWAAPGLSHEDSRDDVLRQMDEWAANEPNVSGHRVIDVRRDPDRFTAWTVEATVDLIEVHDEQPTLWGAA
jgi:hypothetical protein